MIAIGVHCKTQNCGNVIALQAVKDPSENATDNPAVEHPFIVKCDVCNETHNYLNDDLGLFEGQLSK
jgi:hypothetical protein